MNKPNWPLALGCLAVAAAGIAAAFYLGWGWELLSKIFWVVAILVAVILFRRFGPKKKPE